LTGWHGFLIQGCEEAALTYGEEFLWFDPVLTYSRSNDAEIWFAEPFGELTNEPRYKTELDRCQGDANALFQLGKQAFELAANPTSREQFDEGLEKYHSFVSAIRKSVHSMLTAPEDSEALAEMDAQDSSDVLLTWLDINPMKIDFSPVHPYSETLGFASLIRVDLALGMLLESNQGSITHTVAACEMLHLGTRLKEIFQAGKKARSDLARRNAQKRHEENHSMRADVIDFYKANKAKFKSVEKAAEEIAGKLVNVSHRTTVKWISAFNKKSAQSPKPK
jgi:hypothetical protein